MWQKYDSGKMFVFLQILMEFLAAPSIAKVGVGIADDLKVTTPE